MIVDGGLLSNFPVWLFDVPAPSFPTFGLQLTAPARQGAAGTGNDSPPTMPGFVDYLKSLASTATGGHDRFELEAEDYARTISISTLGVTTTEFNIAPERVQALIQSGRDAVTKFLETWNFQDWLAAFRATPQSAAPPPAVPA